MMTPDTTDTGNIPRTDYKWKPGLDLTYRLVQRQQHPVAGFRSHATLRVRSLLSYKGS